jgi:glycosyltransferase involved in cell wall biosynthesis
MSKTILIIAYHYPPGSEVGGLRISKLIHFLSKLGWESTILTVKDKYRNMTDHTMAMEIAPCSTVKTFLMPRFSDLAFFISGMLKKRSTEGRPAGRSSPPSSTGNRRTETLFARLKRYYISCVVLLPDVHKNWIGPAVTAALGQIRKIPYDVIMTSAPPFSSHIIGLILKKVWRKKWVADFRDPWVDGLEYRPFETRSQLSDALEKWLEKLVVKNADLVLTTTDALRDQFRNRYRKIGRDKFVSLPHGFESEKFDDKQTLKRFESFTISYLGTLYMGRTPEPLFEALASLLKEGKITPDSIRVHFYGDCEYVDGKKTADLASDFGLKNIVQLKGHVSYDESLDIMVRSHLLLVIANEFQRLSTPAKIYDYLGSGTRLLALSNGGATDNLLKETSSGDVFSPQDIRGLSDFIFNTMGKRDDPAFRNDPTSYRQFHIDILARKLNSYLD